MPMLQHFRLRTVRIHDFISALPAQGIQKAFKRLPLELRCGSHGPMNGRHAALFFQCKMYRSNIAEPNKHFRMVPDDIVIQHVKESAASPSAFEAHNGVHFRILEHVFQCSGSVCIAAGKISFPLKADRICLDFEPIRFQFPFCFKNSIFLGILTLRHSSGDADQPDTSSWANTLGNDHTPFLSLICRISSRTDAHCIIMPISSTPSSATNVGACSADDTPDPRS